MLLNRIVNPDGSVEMVNDFGLRLRTHAESDDCRENGCCIHNPTMTDVANAEGWPYNWRTDRGLMERICPHGIGHPDLDGIRYLRRTEGDRSANAEELHGCDWCCRL